MQACGIYQGGNLIQEVQQLLSNEAAEGVSQAEALDVSTSEREQEACGRAPLLEQEAANRAKHNSKAQMLAQVHCNGYSKPVLVLGALGVQALLKSPAVTEEAR